MAPFNLNLRGDTEDFDPREQGTLLLLWVANGDVYEATISLPWYQARMGALSMILSPGRIQSGDA